MPHPPKIWLIDDDHVQNMFNRRLIERTVPDCSVVTFSSGTEALDLAQSIIRKGDSFPCLILVDLLMPVMDGFQFLEQLEKLLETNDLADRTLINVLSSTEDKRHIEKFVRAPLAQRFIYKPLTRDKVRHLIHRMSC